MKNIKKSLIAVAVLATFPIQGICALQTGHWEDLSGDIDVHGPYDIGIYSDTETFSFSGKEIRIDITPGQEWKSGPVGVYALGPGAINLGSNNTENISINVTDNAKAEDVSIGLFAKEGGKLEVQAKQLNIKVNSENGWAYGISSQGNGVSSTSLIINADTNIEASGAKGGNALVALSSSSLTINGNLRAIGRNALTARGDAIVRINESGQYTTVLEGDINFNFTGQSSGTTANADVLVNLTGKDSKWTGIVRYSHSGNPPTEDHSKISGFKLILADGAQWNTKEPNNYEDSEKDEGSKAVAVNVLTLNDGVINILENTSQVVEAEKLLGSGGTINVAATISDGQEVSSSKFLVGNVEGIPRLTVNADGVNADEVTNSEVAMESFYASALGENSPVKEATLNIAEGDVSGALSGQMTNGVLTTTEVANTVNSSLIDIASSNYLFFRSQINDVSARLGDLRSMPKTAGAWVRYYGGENKYSGKDMKEKYHTLQIGADKFINDNFYLGGTFSYTKGDGTLANGSTDDKNFNFGIYGGWMGEKGQFVDVIIKRHRLKSDFDLYSGNGVSSGNFHNWATSASVEAGWRFNCPSNGFYAEPQVELQVGHVDSANYTTSRGVKVKQKGIDSVIGRAGVAVGYSFPENKGNAYAMASVLHDWKGEVKSTFANDAGQNRTYSEDLGGTWGEFALGGTYNPTKNVSAYGQFKTSTGSPVRNPWQVSVGLRYNF